MRALRLDYQRDSRPVPWLGLGVLASALVALVVIGGYYRDLGQSIESWEDRVAHAERLASRRAVQPASAQATRALAQEVEQANQVLRQLSLPWDALFKAVEASGGKDVALLSMEPDVGKGVVKISAEAKNFDAMLEYVRRLGKRDLFESVLLQEHQVQQNDPEKPIRFSLLAAWRTGTL